MRKKQMYAEKARTMAVEKARLELPNLILVRARSNTSHEFTILSRSSRVSKRHILKLKSMKKVQLCKQ